MAPVVCSVEGRRETPTAVAVLPVLVQETAQAEALLVVELVPLSEPSALPQET